MNGSLQHNSGPGVTTRYFITTGVAVCPAPFHGEARTQYIQKCLRSQTVSVLTQRGELLHDCLLLTSRATTEDGFLELLGIPTAESRANTESDAAALDARSGLVTGTAVIVFPLDGSLTRVAVAPIAAGAAPELFRLWAEHQRRDRHMTPNSTFEEMIDGEGGYNLWFKNYSGERGFDETAEALVQGTTGAAGRASREERLQSTTRVRITPQGKLIITLAKITEELTSTNNLEAVKDRFSDLDAYDDADSPHIVIDPSNTDGTPSIHVDSGNAEIDMDKDRVRIHHKINQDVIVMENGKIRIVVGNDGIVELNGGNGQILSTKNLPACLVTGTPFLGSPTERTKQ